MGTGRDYLAGNVRRLQQRQEMIMRMIDKKSDLMPALLQAHRQQRELPLSTPAPKTVYKAKHFQVEDEWK